MIFLNQIPFLRVLLPLICGIAVWLLGFTFLIDWPIVAGIYGLCLLLYFLLIKKSQTPLKLFFGISLQLFLFFAGYFICKINNEKQNPHHYTSLVADSTQLFCGYVSEIPVEKTKSVKAELTLQKIKQKDVWQNTSGKIIVYFEKTEKTKTLEIGTNIIFSGNLQEIQAPLNPHEFDYKSYLRLRNIYHSVYLKEGNWSAFSAQTKFSMFAFSQKIRKYLLDTYRTSGLESNEFAMVAALVLGYDDEIDRPTMNAYSHTGTLHVLSVSGLHVGLIYMLLGYMLAFLDRNKKTIWLKVLLITGVLWFFVLLSGFSAPAVRAAFMFSLMLFGKTLFQQVETANIVLVAAFFSLCINPFWLADVGFQLSYIAILGLIYLFPFIKNLFSFSWKISNTIWTICAVSIAAQLATLPLTLYYFHQFPALFIVTNLVVIPISIAVMYGGMMLLLFSKITIVAKILVWITALLIKLMNACALYFDGLPFCVIDNIHLSLINMILLYVLILLLFISIEEKSYELLMSCFGLSICIMLISLFFDLQVKNQHQFTIYQSDKANVLTVFNGNKCTQFADTIIDDRLQSTLRENKIYHDVVLEERKLLSAISLIKINHKKILFVKNINLLSEKLIAVEKPDFIWLTGASLKNKKLLPFICNQKNILVSGKVGGKKNLSCLTNSYLTTKQGAFIGNY